MVSGTGPIEYVSLTNVGFYALTRLSVDILDCHVNTL
jgi:hypothetical protein